MDLELARLVDIDTPKLNAELANGLATSHMQYVEKYLDDVFRTVAKDFPEGLVYAGCSRCTPKEEYREAIRKRNTRRGLKKQTKSTYETAQSDIYLMKYFFKYKGESLETRYLYLPFVSQAGSIVLGGSRFNISPVLSDRVVSIGQQSIFVRLLRDKFTFQRLPYSYMTQERRENVQIVYGQIYHSSGKKQTKPSVPAVTTAAHYLLCKYGFTETFRRFANCEPIVLEGVNPNEWPEDQWVICESMKAKPKCFNRVPYTPTNLVVIVPRHKYTPVVKSFIAAFFYVVDHFPQWITQKYIDYPRQWMLAMGHMLFPSHINHGRLYDDIGNHIESLDEYVDPIMRAKMDEIGIHVNDMYEFLAFIIEKFNDWLLTYSDKINSMFDKELSVLYYVLYDITAAIFKAHFKLKAAAKKELTSKEINNILAAHLKTGLIYGITKKSQVVSSNSYSGDNKAFKITSVLVPQSSSSAKGKNKNSDRAAISDPSKKMHVSIAEIGSYSGMPKSEPTGRGRLNHHCHIDHKGAIVRNGKFVDFLDHVQDMIKA